MSKTRDKYISMRVDESIYNEVKKRADSAGQTVSEYNPVIRFFYPCAFYLLISLIFRLHMKHTLYV